MEIVKSLLVTPDYPPPPEGIQTLTQNLETGFLNVGHSVELLHLNPESFDATWRNWIPKPARVHSPKTPAARWLVYNNALQSETERYLAEFSPDLVHATRVRCWPVLECAREHGIPAVLSTHALEFGE